MRALSLSSLATLALLLSAMSCAGEVRKEGGGNEGSEGVIVSSSGDGDGNGGSFGQEDPPSGGMEMPGPPDGVGGEGQGGAAPITIDIDLWCPQGEQWDLLFGDEAPGLGGAPPSSECPSLPSLTYADSYCSTTFTSTEPVRSPTGDSCCYGIRLFHCR